MNRSILTCVLVAASCGLVCAQTPQQPDPQAPQQTPSSDPYSGVSHPPSDDTIVTTQSDQPNPPRPKPRAGKPFAQAAPAPPAPAQPQSGPSPSAVPPPPPQPSSVDPSMNFPDPDAPAAGTDTTGTDSGTVSVAPSAPPTSAPGLMPRNAAADPDGDIVHPTPDTPGALPEGTMIRVRLLTPLSTNHSQRGDEFRSRVASDVVQDGQVLIPTGAEIIGRVVDVSSGTTRGRGSMRLRPDWVILPDGQKYRLDAQVTGTPGSNTHVSGEGKISAGSRYKKDGMEYAAGAGGGVIVGGLVAGPPGALAGGLIGAGAITVHLMMDHSQADLEPGTVLIFSLNDRLNLQTPGMTGN